MKKFALLLILFFAAGAAAAPKDAVVMLPSHGCSGTVIWTGEGRTYVLTCAHAFEGKYATMRITVKAPAPASGRRSTGGIRLLRKDHRLDVALVELPAGPLPYVCPVAPASHRVGRDCASVGYDAMRLPSVNLRATVLGGGGPVTYTVEKPGQGRSGGALIDRGMLVGTVQGYETRSGGRGMYTSLGAIRQFLGPDWPNPPSADFYAERYYDAPPTDRYPVERFAPPSLPRVPL